RQTADAGLAAAESYPTDYTAAGSEQLAIGDVNGNGRADVVVATYDGFGILYDAATKSADLTLSMTARPEPVGLDEPLTFQLDVHNGGEGDAARVVVRDPLPSGFAVIGAVASQGTCDAGAVVVCELGLVGAGQSASIALTVDPQRAGRFYNDAAVSSISPDSEGNKDAFALVHVAPADLALSLTGSGPVVAVEEPLSFVMSVSNLGPYPAADVHV